MTAGGRGRSPDGALHRWRRGPGGRAAVLVGAVAAVLAGCGAPAPRAGGPAPGYPVTIGNCAAPTITVDRPPERVVSSTLQLTDSLIALGLESRLVAAYGISSPIAERYRAGYARVPRVSPGSMTLENVVGDRPDLVFAGWNDGLTPHTALAPDSFARHRIPTLIAADTCGHVDTGRAPVSPENTVYQDLRHLGAIFGVPGRAEAVIDGMQARIAAVQRQVAGRPPVTVFVYNFGEAAPGTAPGLAPPTALLALAGGRNIFADLRQDWTTVSWEQVVAADPQCIVIKESGKVDGARAARFISTNPITRNLTAVRRQCFLALDQDELNASPRNDEAVEKLARWLHPDAFAEPAPAPADRPGGR